MKSQYVIILDDNENENSFCDNCNISQKEKPINTNTYYQLHKEEIKEKYQQNAEKRRTYQIEYNQQNHDKYLDYQKKYYDEKKESILRSKREKVLCECGKLVSQGHLTTHKKTNIHLKNIKNNTSS
jgi:hypothetical protein